MKTDRIVVVGTGRVASQLAPALEKAGYDVVLQPSRHIVSVPQADLYVVAVKDDALESVVGRLRELTEAPIVHTAGSISASVADGVLYPMQTFSNGREVDFRQIHFFIEASSPEVSDQLRRVAGRLSADDHVHELDSAHRRYLHLAAVFSCNFVNHCCTLAEHVLGTVGLPFDIMLPLLDETVAKLHGMSPLAAQTGPAVRQDENVMASQQALLSGEPQMQDIYRLMSQSIICEHNVWKLTNKQVK